jgi:hypothetical protein
MVWATVSVYVQLEATQLTRKGTRRTDRSVPPRWPGRRGGRWGGEGIRQGAEQGGAKGAHTRASEHGDEPASGLSENTLLRPPLPSSCVSVYYLLPSPPLRGQPGRVRRCLVSHRQTGRQLQPAARTTAAAPNAAKRLHERGDKPRLVLFSAMARHSTTPPATHPAILAQPIPCHLPHTQSTAPLPTRPGHDIYGPPSPCRR